MSDDAWDLQQALFATLSAALSLLPQDRIYDNVPDSVSSASAPDSAFPYVQIGEGQALPDDSSGDDRGMAETIDLHVWSRYAGQKQAKQIMAQIKDALHGVSLSVPGRASALSWVRGMRVFLDPDGRTRHGVVSVEIIYRS